MKEERGSVMSPVAFTRLCKRYQLIVTRRNGKWKPCLNHFSVLDERRLFTTLRKAEGSIADGVTSFAGSMKFVYIHGIWFGIFVTVMATIGLISPPTGMTVFVIQAQNPDIPVARIYRGTLAFLAADFVLVGMLIAWPGLVSWLPAVLKM